MGVSGAGIDDISTLTITACQIANNTGAVNGSGIYRGGSAVTPDACTATGKKAATNGGGMIRGTGRTMTLLNRSTVTNNLTDNCFGTDAGCKD